MYPFNFFGLILAFLCVAVTALHESDVGVVDWYQPHIGLPLISSLSTAPTFQTKTGQPRAEALLLTATDGNVLAALNVSSGSIGAYHTY